MLTAREAWPWRACILSLNRLGSNARAAADLGPQLVADVAEGLFVHLPTGQNPEPALRSSSRAEYEPAGQPVELAGCPVSRGRAGVWRRQTGGQQLQKLA
jgi:hypothetical protein